jgi:spastin
LFTGICAPTRGILLYGPPGNGKTTIAKAIATECNSKFFSVSASTLLSKWVGESERLVRTLFTLAYVHEPSIIFIDEIDSILSARSSGESEHSRQLKTEILIQIEGVTSHKGRLLVIGATNRPFDLDEAALRRMPNRIFIGLPDSESRKSQIQTFLNDVKHSVSEQELTDLVLATEGYSSSDLSAIFKDVAMSRLRDMTASKLLKLKKEDLRPVHKQDFEKTL